MGKFSKEQLEKITQNPVLVDVWAQFKGDFTPDELANIFKKLPEDGDFYKKFEETFKNGDNLNDSARDFLRDIRDGGDDLLKVFTDDPNKISDWNILKDKPYRNIPKYIDYVNNLKTPKLGNAVVPPRLNDYAERFKIQFQEIREQVFQVHHAIPQYIWRNRPDILSESELHSIENLRGIPKDNPGFHQVITNRWTQFYTDFPNFTKEQVLNFAKAIDDEFGKLFVPPVR